MPVPHIYLGLPQPMDALAFWMRMAHPQGLALVLSGGGARAAYQVGVLRFLAREFPTVVPDILTGVSAGGINAAFLAARQEPYPAEGRAARRDLERPAHRGRVPRRPARSGVAQRAMGRTAAVGRQVSAAAGQEPRRHRAAARGARARAATPSDGPIAGIQTQPERRLAAAVRADRVELHDRPVDHLGADARRLRHADVGAAAAQEPRAARCASIT